MAISINRVHDRPRFFKYMSATTARTVLSNHTLRWSSPLLFNDPFDVPRELFFDIDPSEIVEALRHRMIDLIEHPPRDTSDLEPNVRVIVETVKKGISPESKTKMLADLKDSSASHRPDGTSMEAFRDFWRNSLRDLRILCLTENPNHVAMWFHYADKYKGAVLEFGCDDELDSAWLVAQPVTYPEEKPDVYSADGWAKFLTTQHELAVEKILDLSTYTKSPDWSYEKEWRLVSKKRPNDTGEFNDYRFHPEELVGIYLGPLISVNDKKSLLSAAMLCKNARIFEVTIGMSRDLHFNKIRS